MKVLLVNGSPRKNGITAKMLKLMEKEIGRSAKSEYINILDYKIAPCVGCNKCRPDKRCFQKDDGNTFGDKILEADIVVIGTPTYWGNMSAPLKNAFDRIVPFIEYINTGFPKPRHKGKSAVIMTASAAPFPINRISSLAGGAVKSVKTILKAGGFGISGVIMLGGASAMTDIPKSAANKIKSHSKKIKRIIAKKSLQ
jgi:NAD(P)H-dependent FMN reductase